SLTMDRPKKPTWLKKGAEGSSTLAREELTYRDPNAMYQEKRAKGWAQDPSPRPLDDATNLRPSKMGQGTTPKSHCPWQYEAPGGMIHKSELTDPMDIPRPDKAHGRGKSKSDPKRIYS